MIINFEQLREINVKIFFSHPHFAAPAKMPPGAVRLPRPLAMPLDSTTTKHPPSSRARDYFLDVGSKTEMKCGTFSNLVKVPAGYLLNMPNCQYN
jgi:hypothetical protein